MGGERQIALTLLNDVTLNSCPHFRSLDHWFLELFSFLNLAYAKHGVLLHYSDRM